MELKKFLNKYQLHLFAFISVIFIFFLWSLGLGKLINSLELVSYDWRAQLATDGGQFQEKFIPADSKIILLSADDTSFAEIDKHDKEIGIGRWPWTRETWANVVNYVQKGNPKAIIFDIKFEGNEGNTYKNIKSDDALANSFKGKHIVIATAATINRKNDAQKVINNNIILPAKEHGVLDKIDQNTLDLIVDQNETINDSKTDDKNIYIKVDDSSLASKPIMDKDAKKLLDNITYYNYSAIPEKFLQSTKVGVVNVDTNAEMLVRYNIPLYRIVKDQQVRYLPSLSLASALASIPEDERSPIILKKNKILIGKKRKIPITDEGRVLINWHGKGGTYKSFSVSDIIISDAIEKKLLKKPSDFHILSPKVFNDKIIVIGLTAAGTDIHITPMSYDYPGPEVVSTVIDNYINDANKENTGRRNFVKRVPFSLTLLITIFYCLSIGFFNVKSKNNYVSFFAGFLIMTLYVMSSVVLFAHPSIRLWVDIIFPMGLMIITSFLTYVLRIYFEKKNKENVESLFGKFVSPEVLKQILNSTDGTVHGNQRKEMTVLFSDIRGFTTLSETIPADILIPQINEYFNEMVDIVLANKGTMDKFIGDAVMAFWNDPIPVENHEYLAVKTAVEMIIKVEELNEKWTVEGKPQFKIGTGINSGEMLVGYMGSSKIVDYTVIGDNVNLASRIESLCKEYKVPIIISEATYLKAQAQIKAEYLDDVIVKGKKNSVKIYKITGLNAEDKEYLPIQGM